MSSSSNIRSFWTNGPCTGPGSKGQARCNICGGVYPMKFIIWGRQGLKHVHVCKDCAKEHHIYEDKGDK